jgi:hypothetical protein
VRACPAMRNEGRLRNEANKSFVFTLPVHRGGSGEVMGQFWPNLRTASQRRVPGNLALQFQGPKRWTAWGTLRRLPPATRGRAGGLYGENWIEDVKIRLFLDNVGSQNARMLLPGFLGFN